MKYLHSTSILLIFLTIISCSSESEGSNPLIGKWKLVATLNDPGDGSGTFRTIDSDREIVFLENGEMLSNEELCSANPSTSAHINKGKYSYELMELYPDDCSGSFRPIRIEVENGFLDLHYFCFEPCIQKYTRID